jgi:hypothetical protein
MKRKINKVIKGLKKASKTHAGQAKTLESIKMKKGGGASKTPSNVTNPSLYSRVKSEAKRKFDVYPSAYANAWLVKTYKKRGGGYKGAKKAAEGGEMSKLKPIPTDNKGLKKLPTKVRNKMGFMRNGGEVMMVQGRGCGAMMQSKRKKTKVPRS